jgi:hypothetical protein
MPTVLRVGGFAFSFFPGDGDHEPPHVHVSYAGKRIVVEVESGYVRRIQGMSVPDIRTAQKLVQLHRDELLAAWRKWHPMEES